MVDPVYLPVVIIGLLVFFQIDEVLMRASMVLDRPERTHSPGWFVILLRLGAGVVVLWALYHLLL